MELSHPTELTLGRYRNRMRDMLDIDSTGQYLTSAPQEVRISRGLNENLELTGKISPYFSAETLMRATLGVDSTFEADFEKLTGGHSMAAFSIIGE